MSTVTSPFEGGGTSYTRNKIRPQYFIPYLSHKAKDIHVLAMLSGGVGGLYLGVLHAPLQLHGIAAVGGQTLVHLVREGRSEGQHGPFPGAVGQKVEDTLLFSCWLNGASGWGRRRWANNEKQKRNTEDATQVATRIQRENSKPLLSLAHLNGPQAQA